MGAWGGGGGKCGYIGGVVSISMWMVGGGGVGRGFGYGYGVAAHLLQCPHPT